MRVQIAAPYPAHKKPASLKQNPRRERAEYVAISRPMSSGVKTRQHEMTELKLSEQRINHLALPDISNTLPQTLAGDALARANSRRDVMFSMTYLVLLLIGSYAAQESEHSFEPSRRNTG